MKRPVLRNLISLITVICLIVLPLASSVSAQTEQAETCPTIYVPGFMGNDVYTNPGTDEQKLLFPPSTDEIIETIKSCMNPLVKFTFNGDWDSLGSSLAPIIYKLLSPVYNDENGIPAANTGANWQYPDADTLRADGEYTFEYDWRLDPVDIAAQLKGFVDYVKTNTGAQKVNIQCHSMGGVVMLSYITLYGYDDFNAILYDTTAIYGETFNGELFTNKLELSDDSIVSYMRYILFGSKYEEFLNNIVSALYKTGVINGVCDIGNLVLEKTYGDIARVIVPMFAYYPGIWAMIPDEYIPDARAYVFGEILANEGKDYTALEAKLDYYDANIRSGKGEKLLDSADHMRVGVISRYNFSSIPATQTWFTMTDGTVDSASSSFGATFADCRSTLSDEYISSLSTTKYLSPDRVVDASTALFPDRTWFFKDLGHSRGCSTIDELADTFFHSENLLTVDADERFPQFMIFDSVSQKAFPLDEDDVENGRYTSGEVKKNTIFSFVTEFFAGIIDYFRSLFKSVSC